MELRGSKNLGFWMKNEFFSSNKIIKDRSGTETKLIWPLGKDQVKSLYYSFKSSQWVEKALSLSLAVWEE